MSVDNNLQFSPPPPPPPPPPLPNGVRLVNGKCRVEDEAIQDDIENYIKDTENWRDVVISNKKKEVISWIENYKKSIIKNATKQMNEELSIEKLKLEGRLKNVKPEKLRNTIKRINSVLEVKAGEFIESSQKSIKELVDSLFYTLEKGREDTKASEKDNIPIVLSAAQITGAAKKLKKVQTKIIFTKQEAEKIIAKIEAIENSDFTKITKKKPVLKKSMISGVRSARSMNAVKDILGEKLYAEINKEFNGELDRKLEPDLKSKIKANKKLS